MTFKPADLLRIRQLPLLHTADAETFSRLTRSAFLQRFPRDAQLAAEGEVNDFLSHTRTFELKNRVARMIKDQG